MNKPKEAEIPNRSLDVDRSLVFDPRLFLTALLFLTAADEQAQEDRDHRKAAYGDQQGTALLPHTRARALGMEMGVSKYEHVCCRGKLGATCRGC